MPAVQTTGSTIRLLHGSNIPVVATSGSVTDHGSLTGLADDDHLQYLLINGARAMTGSLNMNGNVITNLPSLSLSNTIPSTGTGSGTLIVGGGAGFNGSVYCNLLRVDNIEIDGTSITTFSPLQINTSAGDHIFLNPSGSVVILSTNDSTNTNTGALIIRGGLTTSKDIFVGGSINVLSTNTSTLNAPVKISATTPSTNTATGALIIDGGLAVQDNINVSKSVKMGENLRVESTSVFVGNTLFDNKINNAGNLGDMLVGNGTTMTTLTVGSSGQILRVNSSVPTWSNSALLSQTTVSLSGITTTTLDSNLIGAFQFSVVGGSGNPMAIFNISKNLASKSLYDSFFVMAVSNGTTTNTSFNITWPASSGIIISKSDVNENGNYTVTRLP